jgi:uncharacterized protein
VNHTPAASQAVVLMGKLPKPGAVKTRLTPAVSPVVACWLYEAFLADTFRLIQEAVRLCPVPTRCCFAYAPTEDFEDSSVKARALAPPAFSLLIQEGRDLGARIAHARRTAEAERVVIVGADAPTTPSARLHQAFEHLADPTMAPRGAVFGPALDGGYYLVGFRGDCDGLLEGIPWSTSTVMEATRARGRQLGIPLRELGIGRDVDTVEDLRSLYQETESAGLAPATRAAIAAHLPKLVA